MREWVGGSVDRELRKRQRQASAEVEALQAELRSGQVPRERVMLAARLGHPEVAKAFGLKPAKDDPSTLAGLEDVHPRLGFLTLAAYSLGAIRRVPTACVPIAADLVVSMCLWASDPSEGRLRVVGDTSSQLFNHFLALRRARRPSEPPAVVVEHSSGYRVPNFPPLNAEEEAVLLLVQAGDGAARLSNPDYEGSFTPSGAGSIDLDQLVSPALGQVVGVLLGHHEFREACDGIASLALPFRKSEPS